MSIYEGYLSFGGNEIINNTRTRGIAESASPCPMWWLKGPTCQAIRSALFEQEGYTWPTIQAAPWYDPDVPQSADFFGFFAHSITEALDSTRTVSRTEGIDHGGVLGRTRKATKTMRVRGLLMGRGRRAIEYGQTWLSAALDPGTCGQHGDECGLTDVEWFADCPPERATVTEPNPDPEEPPIVRPQTDAEYQATIDQDRRFLHDVAAISGPIITNTLNSGEFWAYEVELVIGAERPWVYGVTRDVDLPPTLPVIIQDIPYNLVPYPSAELAVGDVAAARNLSTNPSVETNATDWAVEAGGAIAVGNVAGARSTALAAVGAASYRALFTAPSAGANGWFGARQVIPIASAAQRHSINMWAAGIPLAGASVLGTLQIIAEWRNAANAVLRTDTLGSVPVSGGVVSAPSILPPAGTTNVLVRARLNVTSWPNAATIQLFADALAVTVP
ncbi:minor tail protein [Microbacterium phage Terij]|uniref:Minor tail protein n=1 Tax=Microbacterium phage Terij TaxID=2686229 RepID=A0A6B9L6A7_9CAUD|nr:minor tail protein [Microbacterium phage Terij]QHB37167.1 minor tail protein [Microbacterium phage Terij]